MPNKDLRLLTSILLALLWKAALVVDPVTAVPAYAEPTADGDEFSNLLKVELARRKGMVKVHIDVVRKLELA